MKSICVLKKVNTEVLIFGGQLKKKNNLFYFFLSVFRVQFNTDICIWVCVSVSLCVSVCRLYLCLCVSLFAWVYLSVSVCLSVCASVCVFVCVKEYKEKKMQILKHRS